MTWLDEDVTDLSGGQENQSAAGKAPLGEAGYPASG